MFGALLATAAILSAATAPKLRRPWIALDVVGIKLWQTYSPGSVFEIKDSSLRNQEMLKRIDDFDAKAGNGEGCPVGMVRVSGQAQDWRETLDRQNKACLDRGWNPRYLCTRFDAAKLKAESLNKEDMDFCIDRFEFPNIPGEYPAVAASWFDAENICRTHGKRLCSENEWTFACEGPQALPYPYGYNRYLEPRSHFPDHVLPGEGCNIDVVSWKHKHIESQEVSLEQVDRLWHGVPSGSRSRCVSSFGVYDLTGNVEEWTTHSQGRPRERGRMHQSILKGGYWFPVESRCQVSNSFHGPSHTFYQTGFRCCAGI